MQQYRNTLTGEFRPFYINPGYPWVHDDLTSSGDDDDGSNAFAAAEVAVAVADIASSTFQDNSSFGSDNSPDFSGGGGDFGGGGSSGDW
jgi:uncharacterized membrane protein YgcG